MQTKDIFDKRPSILQEDYLRETNGDREKAISILEDELENGEWRYKCECGGDTLDVEDFYIIKECVTKTLYCKNEEDCTGTLTANGLIAARVVTKTNIQYRDIGYLDEEHYMEVQESNELLEEDSEIIEQEIECKRCYDKASEDDWKTIDRYGHLLPEVGNGMPEKIAALIFGGKS